MTHCLPPRSRRQSFICTAKRLQRDNIDTITSSGETRQDLIAIRLIGNDVTIAWGNSTHKSQVRTLLTFDRLRRHWNDNLALCRIPNIFGKTKNVEPSRPA